MKNKIQKGLSFVSLFVLALSMLPLGNVYASEKVEPTKLVIEQNNLEANGFKIANDQVLTSEDVVKLSNVKSVDNLVDVNNLTVSNDQLAKVNQVNPDGGLYNLTLTYGQQANITVPVVKEGSLTTTNSKGALIFKNLALSQEANTKEKVLEETGVYSVAFNNGYVNSDLTVDISKNSTVVKDTNLGLSKEIPNNMSSQYSVENHTEADGGKKVMNFQQPNSDSTILETGKTNPEKSVSMADENFAALIAAANPINVTSWSELKEKVNNQASGELQVYALPKNISIDNTTITINKGQRVVITSQANKTTVSFGEGTNSLRTNLFKVTNGILDVNNVDFVGTLPEGAVAAKNLGVAAPKNPNLSENVFDIDGNNALANFYNNIEFKNQKIGQYGSYGAFGEVQNGATVNTYGGKFHNLHAQAWGGTFDLGPNKATGNFFLGEHYDQWNTASSGPFDHWQFAQTQENEIHRWFGTSIHDNYSKSNGTSFAFAVQGSGANRDTTGGEGRLQIYGKTKIYDNFLFDSASGAITQRCNWGALYNASAVSQTYDKYSEANKIYNPTPDTNVWIGQTEHSNMDDYFNRNPYGGANGYVVLAEIVYTDPALEKMYANNGVAEGIHGDWEDASSAKGTISKTGNYRVVEKQINGKNYAVLVNSATQIEIVTTEDPNGTADTLGHGYTSNIEPGTSTNLAVPVVSGKRALRVELISNEKTAGNGSVSDPSINPTDLTNQTSFTLKDNNAKGAGNVYKTKLRIVYGPEIDITLGGHDSTITSSFARQNANNIEETLKSSAVFNVTVNGNGQDLTANSSVTVTSDKLQDIKSGVPGVYNVLVGADYQGSHAERNFTLTIVADNGNLTPDKLGWVDANNGRISTIDAQKLESVNSLESVLGARGEYRGQTATINGTPNLSIQANDFNSIKAGKPGIYNVTVVMDGDNNPGTVNDRAEKTVILTVFDPASVIPTPDGQGSITAQNTVLTASEAKQQVSSDDSLKAIMKASAEYNGKAVDVKVNSNSQLNDIKAGKVNTNGYAITFSMDADNNPQTVMDNQVVTKKLYVVPDGSAITPDKKGFISAEEIWYRKADAIENFKEDKYIYSNMYGVAVYDGQTLDYNGTNVALTSATLSEIKQGAIKDHDVQFNLSVAGQTASLTKKLHILPNNSVVTPDRFGYISGDKDKQYSPESAINAFAGKQPKELLTTYGIHGYYKGVDITSELKITSVYWTDIQKGRINTFGYDSSVELTGKVEGTNVDDVVFNIKTFIYKDEASTKVRKIGEFPTPVIGSVDQNPVTGTLPGGNSSDPGNEGFLPGDVWSGGINGTDTILTVNQAKQVRSLDDLAEIAQTYGNADSFAITPSNVSFLDPNSQSILDAIQKGQVGTYVMWMYSQNPHDTTHTWGTPVRFVVVNNNTTTNAQEVRDQITWASIDPETVIKDVDVQGLNFTNITDIANKMNAMAARHEKATQHSYSQKFKLATNPTLEFVDATGNPINQSETLAAIKAGQVGDYYVKISNVKSVSPFLVTNGRSISYEVTAEAIGKLSIIATASTISAENFVVTSTEAENLTEEQAKTKANVSAQRDGQDITSQVTANNDQLDAIKQAGANSEAGLFPLTFEVNGEQTTVQVSVINSDTAVDPTKSLFLHATGFEMPLNQAASLNEQTAKTKANVKAWNKDGVDLNGQVTIKSGLTEIQGATEPGAYPLVFTVSDGGKTVDKQVFVTLTDENTVCNGDVCITASNFKYEFDKKAELTDEKQIQEAHAKAWNKKTGAKENITLTNSDAVRNAPKVGPYTVTATAKTASKPFIVSLYDANTSFDDNHFLKAENVSMPLADASGLTDQRIKELAKVMAWEAQTGNDVTNAVTVDNAQLNTIKAATKPGAYPLTFTIGNVSKTIVVSLTDANTTCDGNVCIAANSFTQNLTDVAQLDEAEAIKKAEATAWYTDTVDRQPTVKVNQQQLANIQQTNVAQVFPLTFTTVENPNASKEVNVTVADNNFELTANNITIDLATAKKYTANQLITDTEAKAERKDHSGIGTVVVKDGLDAINQTTKAGLFPVTLSVKEDPNTTKQVFITVTDDNTVVGDKAAITAKNFKLKLNTETASLTADTAKTKAEADAWYLDGHTPKPTINVDTAQLNAIKAANEVGVMDLTFTVADDAKATRTVKVSIYDDNTAISPDESKFLHANDFTITDEEAKALTEATAKNKAGVKAWNADGTDLTPNVKADSTQLAKIKEGIAGKYPLKFTVDGLEKTVNVNVTDKNTVCQGNVCITANNFQKAIPAGLTEATAKQEAKVKAWYTDNTPGTPNITVNQTQLDAINAQPTPIVLPLGFSADAATKEVFVTLTDDNSVVDNDELLDANNFTVNLKDVPNADFVQLANAKAWSTIDGTPVNVKLVSSKPTTVGYHDVTFATDKGTTITVKANVVDDATVCTANTCITAQDFNYNLTQAKGLTEAIAKDQAQVKAWYVNGTPGTPTVKADTTMLKAINDAKAPGQKPLKFTVVEDTANQGVQINVNLIDDNYTLTADNIQVNANEKPITAQQVIDKSHATATNNKTQAPGTVVVSPEELDKINNTDKGVIDVTLSVQEQPEVTHTIKVNIVPEGAVVGNKATINAHDFEIKLSKVNKLDDATAKQLAGAEAWYNDGSGDAPIIVNQQQLNAIKNATEGKVLPLTFTVDGDPTATKTIQVTITNDNNAPTITIVDPRYDQATNTIKLKANEAFDPQKMATASDIEDGDLTAQLTITITRTKANVTGNVDTSIAPSEWQATLSVTDRLGATTNKVVNIKVLNTAKPVINGVKDQEITVGAAFDPMAGVTATQGTQDITNLVQVSCQDPNGKVTPTFNSMIIGAHKVTYTVTTEDGQTVSATATITVNPIILPGQDNKPGTPDDVIVKPNPDGKPPVINPDGSVTLPGGGETEFPEGGGVVTPPGSTIKPDGTITTPGGNEVLPLPPTVDAPNGGIELPGDDGDINTKPDNPVVTPDGPNKPSINPDGSVTLPDGGDINYPYNPDNPGGTIITPPGSIVKPDGTIQTPGGGQVDTDESGSIVLPGQDGSLGTPDDVQVNPGGNGDVIINPDGSVTVPGGGTITFPNNPDNNNEITVPNGSNIGQNGQVTPPGANAKPVLPNANGTITIPGADGNLGTPDDGIVTPNGNSTINPDGSITLPGGGTVDLPGDCHLTVEPGGVVLPNGAVINPGANGVLDTPGYAAQAPAQPGNGNQPNARAMANNQPANQGQQATNNVNDDVYLDPAIVCATPVVKPTAQPTAKPQTPTGAASQVVLYATIVAAAVGAIVVIRRNRK